MLKTTGELRERSCGSPGHRRRSRVVVFGFITWTHFAHSAGFLPSPIDVIGMLAAIAAAWFALSGSDGWAFLSSTVTMAAVVATFFIELYPNTMISTTSSAYNITVANAASNPYSLKVMTVSPSSSRHWCSSTRRGTTTCSVHGSVCPARASRPRARLPPGRPTRRQPARPRAPRHPPQAPITGLVAVADVELSARSDPDHPSDTAQVV